MSKSKASELADWLEGRGWANYELFNRLPEIVTALRRLEEESLGLHKAGCDSYEEQQERIDKLEKALGRANRQCENMHHDPSEYHTDVDCPVEKRVNEALAPSKKSEPIVLE